MCVTVLFSLNWPISIGGYGDHFHDQRQWDPIGAEPVADAG